MSILLPYQQRWVMDRSPVKVCMKSRRIGITWATAYEAVEVAATRPQDGGTNVWYQCYAEDDAKEFIEDCGKFAGALNLVHATDEIGASESGVILANPEHDVKVMSIRFASGNRITSLSHHPRKLRGKGGFYISDEVAFQENPLETLKAAQAFRMWGGRIALISTLNGVDNGFWQLCEEIMAGKKPYSLHTYTLPEAVAQGLYRQVCLVKGWEWTQEGQDAYVADLLSTEGAEEEFLCIPSKSGGSYLSRALIEQAQEPDIPVFTLALPEGWGIGRSEESKNAEIMAWLGKLGLPTLVNHTRTQAIGYDFGRYRDLSVITVMEMMKSMERRVAFMLELHNMPHDQQRTTLFEVARGLPRLQGMAIDGMGNGNFVAESAQMRWGAELVDMVGIAPLGWANWYVENMPAFKAAFEDGLIKVPRDADVMADLLAIERVKGVPKIPDISTGSVKLKGIKRHGDAAISLALAFSKCKPTPEITLADRSEDLWRDDDGPVSWRGSW